MKNRIVILGSGLAGMSVAYHLNPDHFDAVIFEKNAIPGGTAGTVQVGGFTFDFSGHLLHLRDDYIKKLIHDLLKDNIYEIIREAAIHIYNKLIPYPFQVNTYDLPQNVKTECVNGFKDAVLKYADAKLRSTSLSFAEWGQRTFGQGIMKYFMTPYNEKLWQVNMTEMTAEWCGMFVPQPQLHEVIEGAKKPSETTFGYNATFLYPKKGGIFALSKALAKDLNIKFNTGFEELDWKNRQVTLTTQQRYSYDSLVSSIPLPELLLRMKELPDEIAGLIQQLRWTSVLCVNLGIDRPHISNKSWIYYPEKEFIFYRVGFPMNFTPYAVPPGCSSMYVEISYPPDQPMLWDTPLFLQRIRNDLERAMLLKPTDNIIATNFLPIRYAYVLYTAQRKIILQKIFSFLRENNIFCVGRYGEWKYSYMEEALLDGKNMAEQLSFLR